VLHKREIIYIKKNEEKEILKGFCWVFQNQISNISSLMMCEAGELVNIADYTGKIIATGYANPKTQIAIRILEFKNFNGLFDAKYFVYKIGNALKRREKHYDKPFYRLVFSESDFLPGLIIDRFDKTFVLQTTTAGMDKLLPEILQALETLFQPENILLKNEFPARAKEGLPLESKVIKGEVSGLIEVEENGIKYLANLFDGQKTGWFYDMRENRKLIAEYVQYKRVLDCFCYTGGFGILAAKHGARTVTFVDSSEPALSLAKKSAELNKLENLKYLEFRKNDVIEELNNLAKDNQKFDVILLDPPPYAKQKEDKFAAEAGYRKLVQQALPLMNDKGILFLASCSANAPMQTLKKALQNGFKNYNMTYEILHQTHASFDHPVLPILPQTNYLSAVVVRVKFNES
jgi:23S rRNA (cytosine1962-C5)-methyltransferase